ncbi:YjbF family lipoprotein [Dyella sp. LX-66]|uniref:YjbF family lipoprotein n=1 Tax=unclassified Dyella TaxID=2634549 RepID=UPI001BE0F85C|nr:MULTISPECIES: YjbF family lipoprotein [unclassified Dyella]MBT2117264.1 YjbF family lipoprotein [Dyella sp. LX-1]MBT2138328.1 YjbF family lipoprotein [Dyella sp. LX-66]
MTSFPWRASLRLAALAAASGIVAGCTDVSLGSADTIRQAIGGGTDVHPTAASVAAEPYYQLQVNAPGGEAILLLASVQGGLESWYGQDGQAVFLRNGVLVRTVGLEANLDHVAFDGGDPFASGLQHVQAPIEYRRVLDWSPGYRYGITAVAQLEPKGVESVDILGQRHQLRRYDEHVRADGASFDVTNRYWVDPADGFIWKSRQHVAPGQTLELIQLRPYREART